MLHTKQRHKYLKEKKTEKKLNILFYLFIHNQINLIIE